MEKHEELLTRAVEQVVPMELAQQKLKSGKPMRLYLGIDPTGSKLHIGHAVPLRKLRAFQDAGHHIIFLVGSFTAMIGDPSGRDTQRAPLTREKIEENFLTYKEQASKILDFSKVELRYNHEWHDEVSFADLLGIASHFTVQQMMERDMFQRRHKEGKPIAMTEFMYPLMQGYDSVMLDVDCELGGTDQLFNILCGRTLQAAYGKREKFALTVKLIEGTDCRKMSKTYDNCVYLDDAPNDMYGKLMSVKDELMLTYFECCTNVSMSEIKEIEKSLKKGTNPKEFKMRLAKEIVTLYHGADAAAHAEQQFTSVFTNKELPDDMPEVKVKKGSLPVDVLLEQKLIPSKAEFRRLVEQGGITMNEEKVTELDVKAETGVVKVGKRKFLRINVS